MSVEEIASGLPTGSRDVGGGPDRPNPTEGTVPAAGTANLSGTSLDRAAWLARRREGIGASDVAGILGLSPWQSPWSIWADKVGLTPLDDSATEGQEFGLMAESMLKQYFELRTGLKVYGVQAEHAHPEHHWMRCTVDGLIGSRGLLEVYEAKTTIESPSTWDEGVPVHYQCQATWAMAVTNAQRVWFGVLHMAFGRPQFRVYQFDRDEANVCLVVDRVTAFWNDHVRTGVAPRADGHRATTDALAGAWIADDGSTVEATVPLLSTIERLDDLKAQAKQVDAEITAAENEIKAAMGEATTLTGSGHPLMTWTAQDRTSIDAAALRAHDPVLAARYSKTTSSRVLRRKTTKGN